MEKQNIKYPCVFLDRDGTVIYDKNYLSSPSQVKLYSFSAQSINKLHKAGFKVIIITNQSGVAREKFTLKDLDLIHKKFLTLLKQQGAQIDALYFCPHIDEDKCKCRKPKTGMVLEAAKKFNISLKDSFVIGDSIRDYLTGHNMGGKGILIKTGHGTKQEKNLKEQKIQPWAVCRTLKEAVNLIIKSKSDNK
jgi:histidinol-phosphate phosphatase family protein